MKSMRQSEKRAATREAPKADQSDRSQLNNNNKACKKLQENKVSNYNKNYK